LSFLTCFYTAPLYTLSLHDALPISSTDQNKSRWPTANWWNLLLSNVEELQLTIKKEPKSIEDMTAWVDRQISPTIAAIMKAQERSEEHTSELQSRFDLVCRHLLEKK